MKRTKTEAKTTREGHEVATPRLSNMKRGQSCSRNQGSCHQKATGARRAEEYSRCRHLPEILRLSQLRLLWSTFGGLLPLISAKNGPYQLTRKLSRKKAASYFWGRTPVPLGAQILRSQKTKSKSNKIPKINTTRKPPTPRVRHARKAHTSPPSDAQVATEAATKAPQPRAIRSSRHRFAPQELRVCPLDRT